jgi:hypothetical protein
VVIVALGIVISAFFLILYGKRRRKRGVEVGKAEEGSDKESDGGNEAIGEQTAQEDAEATPKRPGFE